MIQELVYTSSPSGLKPGSRGYCTVASSAGMSKPMSEKLESLSGYRHMFPPGTIQADNNPVAHAHVRFSIGGQAAHVLSRIADAGLDYSGRSNKLAHHVVLEQEDLVEAGPVACLQAKGFTLTKWAGDPRVLTPRKTPRLERLQPSNRQLWQTASGDAKWCDYLVYHVRQQKPVYIVYPLGTKILNLLHDAQSLMEPNERWQMTFSTYFTRIPQGVECLVRCIPAGTKEANAALARHDQLCIDLTSRNPAPTTVVELEPSRVAAEPAQESDLLGTGNPTATVSSDFDDALRVAPPDLPSESQHPSVRVARTKRKKGTPLWIPILLGVLTLAGGTLGYLYGTGKLVLNTAQVAPDSAGEKTGEQKTNEAGEPEAQQDQTQQSQRPQSEEPNSETDSSTDPTADVPEGTATNTTEAVPTGDATSAAPPSNESPDPNATATASASPQEPAAQQEASTPPPAAQPKPIHWVLGSESKPAITTTGISSVTILPASKSALVEQVGEKWAVRGLDESGFEATYLQASLDPDSNQLRIEAEDNVPDMMSRTVVIQLHGAVPVFVHASPEQHIQVEGFAAKRSATFEVPDLFVPDLQTVNCVIKVKANGQTKEHAASLRSDGTSFGTQFKIADDYNVQLAINETKKLGVLRPVLLFDDQDYTYSSMVAKSRKVSPLMNAISDGNDINTELEKIIEICAEPEVKSKNLSKDQIKKLNESASQVVRDLRLMESGEKQYSIRQFAANDQSVQNALTLFANPKSNLQKPPRTQVATLETLRTFIRKKIDDWKQDASYKPKLHALVKKAEKLADLEIDIVFHKTKETGGRFRFLRITTREEVSDDE